MTKVPSVCNNNHSVYNSSVSETLIQKVICKRNLVCLWDFQEPEGSMRVGKGPESILLQEVGGPVPTFPEGVLGPRSACFGNGRYLCVPRGDLKRLDIHGPDAQVTVIAWLKRLGGGEGWACQAVAGIWNEHARRQFAMFLNLRIHDSAEQLGAHVSGIGAATPGFKYCMDAAIGATPVSLNQWHCCCITYDSHYAKVYLNGRLDRRGDRNPYRYEHGIFSGGADGGDFTVGAVTRPRSVSDDCKDIGSYAGNCFHGLIGGLAVFDRALSEQEIGQICTGPLTSIQQ